MKGLAGKAEKVEIDISLPTALNHLATRSPHLFGVTERIWPKDTGALAIIALAFHWIIEREGESELDFEREPGVSFNPRPARVGLILINDAKVESAAQVASGILATATAGDTITTLSAHAATELFPRNILELAQLAQLPTSALLDPLPAEAMPALAAPAATIACAIFLDRARQLHRMTAESRISTWEECFQISGNYLSLAERHSPPLYTLLKAWERRFRDRLQRQKDA